MTDSNQNGVFSKIEFIEALRKRPGVAEFFQLPQELQQEDGSRTAMEHIFQAVDEDSSKEITWEEFVKKYGAVSGEMLEEQSDPADEEDEEEALEGEVEELE